MEKKPKRIGEILLQKGLITTQQLNIALSEQQMSKEFLGTILLKKKMIKELDLLGALSEQFNVPLILTLKDLDWNWVKQFSSALILDHKCLPIEKDDWSITFAITNPLDAWAVKKAEEEAKGLKVKLVLICLEEMEMALEKYKKIMKDDISSFFD